MKNLSGYELLLAIAVICMTIIVFVAMLTGNIDKISF